MSDNNLEEVKKTVSEIEKAIKSKNVNAGINSYNTLRTYATDPKVEILIRQYAHDKGSELQKILVQMRQEQAKTSTSNTKTRASMTPVPTINPSSIQKTTEGAGQTTQSSYPDPMPLGKSRHWYNPKIVMASIVIIILIVGAVFLYIRFHKNNIVMDCSADGPFACKQTSLETVTNDNLAQKFIILKINPSYGEIENITVTNISNSLKDCDEIYIDKVHSMTTNNQELKIIFDCQNVTLSDIFGSVVLSYNLNGSKKSSTLSFGSENTPSTAKNHIATSMNSTSNQTTNNTSRTSSSNSSRSNTTTTTGNAGAGGGGGGGGSGESSTPTTTIDYDPPTVTMTPSDPPYTLNSDGITFNVTFTVSATAHGSKILQSITAYVNSNADSNSSSCPNVSGRTKTCYYYFVFPISVIGTSINYYAIARDLDTGSENERANSYFTINDFVPPTVNIISPVNGQSYNNTPSININGNASDNVGVAFVEVRSNNGLWHYASGTTTWSGQTNLHNGTNTIEAMSIDNDGYATTTNITLNVLLRPEIDYVIYNDSLNPSWNDASYNSYVDFTDNSAAYNGAYSISYNGDATGALSIRLKDNATINNVDGYSGLGFYINGTADTSVMVKVRGDAFDDTFQGINISNLTGDWTYVQINLTDNLTGLDPNRHPINDIQFIPTYLPGGNNVTFYVDELRLIGLLNDSAVPKVAITYPGNNTVFNTTLTTGIDITITGNASDDTYIDHIELILNGVSHSNITNMTNQSIMQTNVTYRWNATIGLINRSNIINVTSVDISGKRSASYIINISLNITPDVTSPNVTITFPTNTTIAVSDALIVTSGTSVDNVNGTGINHTLVRLNYGEWQTATSTIINDIENWSLELLLSNGSNLIEAMSVDNSGNNATIRNRNLSYNSSSNIIEPFIIYENNDFTTNWSYENKSVGESVITNSSDHIYSGANSMRVDSNSSGTLNIMLGSENDPGIDATNYSTLRFAIYSNETINISLQLGYINDTNNLYYGSKMFVIPADTWTVVNAGVLVLMNGSTTFNSLGLTLDWPYNVTYYLDNVIIGS